MIDLAPAARELLVGERLAEAEEIIGSLTGPLPLALGEARDPASDRNLDELLDAAWTPEEIAHLGVLFITTSSDFSVPASLLLLQRLLPRDVRVAAKTADILCSHAFDPQVCAAARRDGPLLAYVSGLIIALVERDVLASMWLEVGQIEAEQGGNENSVVIFLRACRFVRGALDARGDGRSRKSLAQRGGAYVTLPLADTETHAPSRRR